jgi:hypothetical protein
MQRYRLLRQLGHIITTRLKRVEGLTVIISSNYFKQFEDPHVIVIIHVSVLQFVTWQTQMTRVQDNCMSTILPGCETLRQFRPIVYIRYTKLL